MTGIDVSGVSRVYGDLLVLDNVEFAVGLHGRLSVVGPSGCGKSTLLSLIAGLEEPDEGKLAVLGQFSARQRLAQCALMPQRDLLLPWRTALDNAALALANRGWSKRDARRHVAPLFERFGLSGFEGSWPGQLSGGMRQRVAFLRTLVAAKEVLLLDEPFGALDSITRADMQDWLRDALADEPRTVVLVTHDVEEALLLSEAVAVMSPRPGRITTVIPVELPPIESRRQAVAMPEFVRLRDRVMQALAAP
jgi:ABC-type nitrate/sulfonate/bicarbonate transport system ATPase subunit